MKRSAIFCLGILVSSNAVAGCDWATTTPPDDSNYKYLVAKSYSDVNASDAANKAERDIDNQVGRLFGTSLNVQSDFYSDETTSAGTTRSYERSIGTITLKGLERQKSDVSRESGGWVGCVQYRYSQKEFKQEKQRLAKLPQSALTNVVFNESVGDTTCNGSPVEIITTPTKAFITIDNGKYQGETPIKFGNVCNGKHSLEITKENYADVNETLIVPNSGKITKTLKRDTKNIKIRTTLGNSRIFINDIDYGKEPVTFKAELGIDQKITAKNSEAVDITRMLSFSKYSEPEYLVNMEKMPGKIDFSAFRVRNPDVKITVDGKTITGKTTGELSSDDDHKIVFSKDGFFDINKSLSINGGETTYYPSKALEFSKTPDFIAEFLFGAGLSVGSDIIGANLDLGGDLKYNLLYLGAGIQYNHIYLPEAKMNFDYKFDYAYSTFINPHSANIKLHYYEILYSNLGFNIGNNLSVFGIGTLGTLQVASDGSKTTASSLKVNNNNKLVFRYGVGLQYSFPFDKKDNFLCERWGIKLQYLTGKANFGASDVKFENQNTYGGLTNISYENKELSSYPKRIDSFNITFFIKFTRSNKK